MTDLSLAGADDPRPLTAQLDHLNGQDRATLRWLTGQHTVQDWLNKAPAERAGVSPNLVVTGHTRLRCAVYVASVQNALLMVRVAPWAYIPAVRP